MGGIIRNQGGKTIEIGDMPDHVHCLARLPARKAVSDILRALKSDSSGWVNRERPGDRFAWQTGYDAFTVSQSQVGKVRRYIQTQAEHHRERSFEEEFLALLEKHGIEYNEDYLWD
jgi:REP element-mobilizing transposase RayT